MKGGNYARYTYDEAVSEFGKNCRQMSSLKNLKINVVGNGLLVKE